MVTIRTATMEDIESMYAIGLTTPEFQVSAQNEAFMSKEEFSFAVTDSDSEFLLAESDDKEIAGFIYAGVSDKERILPDQYACIVYLVVHPNFRRQGIAAQLYHACEQRLKQRGVKGVYSWTSIEGDGAIQRFFEKEGFAAGHTYRWMDKSID